MNTTPTAVKPNSFYMSVVEIQVVDFDATLNLDKGETAANASATLTLMNGNNPTPVALIDAATVSGNVITQTINGPVETQAGGVYRLRVTFTATPSVNVYAMDLWVNVSA